MKPITLFTLAALLSSAPVAFSQPQEEMKKAGREVKEGTKDAGRATGRAAEKTGKATERGAKHVGHGVKSTTDKAVDKMDRK